MEKEKEAAADVYQGLEKLAQLRQKGVLAEEEFEAKNKELLDRL
jgi:hypothetical protein